MRDYRNEIELKLTVKGDNDTIWKSIEEFNSIFRYSFREEIKEGQTQSLLTILKANGVKLERDK